MELSILFKSVLDQDRAAVVICDLEDTIVYMNPAAAESYKKYGGAAILGHNLLDCHNDASRAMIKEIVAWFAKDKTHNMIHTNYNAKKNRDVYMVALRDESGELVGYYEKHECRIKETAKVFDFSASIVRSEDRY